MVAAGSTFRSVSRTLSASSSRPIQRSFKISQDELVRLAFHRCLVLRWLSFGQTIGALSNLRRDVHRAVLLGVYFSCKQHKSAANSLPIADASATGI